LFDRGTSETAGDSNNLLWSIGCDVDSDIHHALGTAKSVPPDVHVCKRLISC
jgi:hypothetical protein